MSLYLAPSGSPGSLELPDILNLRGEVTGAPRNHSSIEQLVDRLVAEKWFQVGHTLAWAWPAAFSFVRCLTRPRACPSPAHRPCVPPRHPVLRGDGQRPERVGAGVQAVQGAGRRGALRLGRCGPAPSLLSPALSSRAGRHGRAWHVSLVLLAACSCGCCRQRYVGGLPAKCVFMWS